MYAGIEYPSDMAQWRSGLSISESRLKSINELKSESILHKFILLPTSIGLLQLIAQNKA